jgi:phage gpG-like protein
MSIRVAVIGLGIGKEHLKAYLDSGICEIAAVSDLNRDLALQTLSEQGLSCPVRSFEEIVNGELLMVNEKMKKWKEVKRKGGKSRRSNSAILVQTGRMRRAVANSLKKATFDLIEFNVTEATAKGGFNYAAVHQFGYFGPVKTYTRKRGKNQIKKRGRKNKGPITVNTHYTHIPQRQFMGQTTKLTKEQIKKVRQVVDKIFD